MMREAIGRTALWAMHPDALAELQLQSTAERLLPDGLRTMLGFASGGVSAAKPADPVRDGATMILTLLGSLSPLGTYGGTATERFADQVREAAADERVGAIVVKIMSPGGLVWGTQEAGDAVFEARQAKPVIAVADKYAFSAAHWIATQASAFYATPSGQVGSVGVFCGHVDMSRLEDNLGLKTTLIASDAKKISGHPYAPLSEEDHAEMQAEINEMAAAFNAAIARGRGMRAADVPAVHGTGQVFSASRAAAAGVTDGVMSLREVMGKFASSRARLDVMRRRAALQHQVIDI